MEETATISSTESGSRLTQPRPGATWASAFTLVEIILAVAILAVMMGGAVVFMGGSSAEDEFSLAQRALESAAQEARAQALQANRDQYVMLLTNGPAKSQFGPGISLDLLTPQEISAGIRDWGTPGSRGYSWYFSRYGWLEPLHVQLRSRDGQKRAFVFVALTGELIPDLAFR